jgi:hypothetical protein
MDNLALVKVVLLVLNPILVSLTLYVVGIRLFRAINRNLNHASLRSAWRKTLMVAGAVIAAYAVVDTAFAYRRVHYGKALPEHPVVRKTTPIPSSITLVDVFCQEKCLDRLVAGVHSEVFLVRRTASLTAERFTVRRSETNDCPTPSQNRLERQWLTAPVLALQSRGICPVIETVAIPQSGIFIVHESVRVGVKESAAEFKSRFLTSELPGPVSYYSATEVQDRSEKGVELLGRIEAYEAPGYLGFPPMVGCWERPDNIVAVLPPGEPGCGLWRLTTGGGNLRGGFFDGEWVYSQVFQSR